MLNAKVLFLVFPRTVCDLLQKVNIRRYSAKYFYINVKNVNKKKFFQKRTTQMIKESTVANIFVLY